MFSRNKLGEVERIRIIFRRFINLGLSLFDCSEVFVRLLLWVLYCLVRPVEDALLIFDVERAL